jgi:hypothetical protein
VKFAVWKLTFRTLDAGFHRHYEKDNIINLNAASMGLRNEVNSKKLIL